ncbi:hypothetical protein C4939_08440 [Salmonella enterica]|nr:hypothetical protein [Salmonella enterica]EHG9308672.1 hypothetical protein [Salmonella enterica]
MWKNQWVSHSTDLYRASYYQPANMQAAHHVSDFLFFPGNKVPELYFNLEKIFSRGLLSPVHAAYLPALRVIFAILQIFAVLPGKCFSHPMISYEKLLSVLVDGSVCHPPSIAGTTPEIKRM